MAEAERSGLLQGFPLQIGLNKESGHEFASVEGLMASGVLVERNVQSY